MSEENQHKIGDILKGILGEQQIVEKYQLTVIKSNWENWMGKAIESRTKDIRLYGNHLVIEVYSAALRQELAYNKEQIIKIVNTGLEMDVIESVQIR